MIFYEKILVDNLAWYYSWYNGKAEAVLVLEIINEHVVKILLNQNVCTESRYKLFHTKEECVEVMKHTYRGEKNY